MVKFEREDALIKTSIYLSYIFLAAGGVFGVLQTITRAPGFPKLLTSSQYYLSISSHGILMVIAWITFFIFGLVFYILTRSLDRGLHSLKLAWASFAVTLIGVFMSLAMLLSGRASVAWTFYAPLHADPLFYIGLVVFVTGTWLLSLEVYLTIKEWRRFNSESALPLGVHGIAATLIMWVISTVPITLEEILLRIPWALNPEIGIDVALSRTLFWWFGHPVVYFWILPAAVVWYVYFPKLMEEEIYSDYYGRVVFMLFIIFSIPVGVHHQFQDPGIPMTFKFVFTVFTYLVGIPSLLTAFNLAATMERAGRRKGGKGLFMGWIRNLPWGDPAFTGITLALILFAMGGITGFINAGYHINAIVHNTVWVVGHFHTTAAGGATLTFIGISYYLIPRLVGKELWSRRLALIQSWTWFIGLAIFAESTAIAGILGSPRRTYDVTYFGAEQAKAWVPYIQISAIGGALMFIGLVIFLIVIILTALKGREVVVLAEEHPLPSSKSMIWDNFRLLAIAAFMLALAVYVPTLLSLESVDAPRVVGATPRGPFAGTVPEISPAPGGPEVDVELAKRGETLFLSKGCSACHSIDGSQRTGPTLKGIFGREISLSTGETVISDEVYLRESILDPDAKIVQGFRPLMMSSVTPSGSVSEEETEALVEYLKTL